MCSLYFLYNGFEFFFLCLVYGILVIDTCYRTVRWNLDNVHSINITELFFLGKCRTGHTGFLVKFVEEVLERNGCKCLALSLNLYMLLRLDCLMQTIGITTSRHDTSGELINDHNLIILYNIILIAEHQIMCTECKDYIMLNLKVICICEVFNMEELLNLMYTLLGKVDNLVLLIHDKVSGLFLLDSHNSIHLGILRYIFTSYQLFCQNITCFVKLCGLSTLSGNDKWRPRFVDQYGIDLIDNCIMQASLHQLLLVDHHIVTQIIKSKLVVCNICNITIICFTTLIVVHLI